jgi:hypothetical protein
VIRNEIHSAFIAKQKEKQMVQMKENVSHSLSMLSVHELLWTLLISFPCFSHPF